MTSEVVKSLERRMKHPPVTGRKRWVRGIVFALLTVLVPLMAAEIGLRAAGYRRPQIPWGVQTATHRAAADALNLRFATDAFEPDRYLLWRMRPGTNVGGITVNSLGLLGSDPERRPEPGAVRVLCMGDSVSALTYRTYPAIAQRLVENSRTTRTLEFLNAAVAGYTTEQALRQWPALRRLKPDLVVICFGWNDHFPALNLPDKELGARNAAAAAAHRALYRTRLYQFAAAPEGERWRRDRPTTGAMRANPDQFETNLRRLVADVRAAGAVAILATQPEHLGPASLGFFREQGFAAGGATASLAERHRTFNAIVRSVATEERAPLLDLAEAFEFRNREVLFEPDGMHLTGPGQNLAARLLVGVLRNEGVLTQGEFDRIVTAARYDTTAPDKPFAAWTLNPARVETTASTTVRVGVLAKNTGNTVWLRRHRVQRFGTRRDVDYGGVAVEGRWRTTGAPTTATAAESRLSSDLFPGESTSNTLEITAPASPGEYSMEIGLRADGLGALSRFGTEVTTLTVVAYPK